MHDSASGQNQNAAGESAATPDEITCRQFVDLITDYFERALGRRTLSHVEEHLVMCDWCVTYLEQMQATIGLLRELRETPPATPSPAVLAALRGKG